MKEMSTLCQSQLDATRHDILDYYKGCTTPNGDIRRALPLVVEKIFGYLDQDALTQARAVSKKWRCYVDTKTPYWKAMTREIIPNSGTWEEDVMGRNVNRFWRAAWCGRMDIVKLMIQYGEPQNFGQALKGAVEGVQRLRNSEMGLIGLRFQCEIVKQILPYMDKKEISKPYSLPTDDTDIDFATGKTCLHLFVSKDCRVLPKECSN